MSKLDELIRELCPNGVENKKLGDIATISRGGNFQNRMRMFVAMVVPKNRLSGSWMTQSTYPLSMRYCYVEAEDTRKKVDIVKLNAEIEEIVAREDVLRSEIRKIIAEIEG